MLLSSGLSVTEHRRNYIRPTQADLASEEAIEDFAGRLWQAFIHAEGIHMTTQLTERYADAVAYAATAHATQKRKGTDIPYVAHLLAVSGSVLEAGGDEEQAIAGLLHDVVEDQGGLPRADDVRARFGDRVADIILGCSDSTVEDREDKLPYAERKAAHIAHLREASDDVLLVTAADKLHNARAIHTDLLIHGPGVLERFNGEPEQILAYYCSILDVLEARAAAPILVVPLRHAVSGMTHELAKIPQYELAEGEAGDWLREQGDSLFEEDSVIRVHGLETWKALQAGRGRRPAHGPVQWSIQACESLTRYPTPWEVWVWTMGPSWQVNVMSPREDGVRSCFRSDGSWIDSEGRRGAWSGVKEGGPESVMRGILRIRRRPGVKS